MMRGPGTNEEQVAKLKEKVGEEGVVEAASICENYPKDVVALAYKFMRVNASQKKLPKSIQNLLDKLPSEDADKISEKLTSVNC